jgi:hypothetical protein
VLRAVERNLVRTVAPIKGHVEERQAGKEADDRRFALL